MKSQLKQNLMVIILMTLSFCSFASEDTKYVPNLADGELLYNEGCVRCHDNSILPIDENSSMADLNELREQISICAYYLDLTWPPDYEEDVAQYLNHNFFHFDNIDPIIVDDDENDDFPELL